MYSTPPANITSRTQAIAEVIPQMAQEHCDFVHAMNGTDDDLKVSEKHIFDMLTAAPLEKVLMFANVCRTLGRSTEGDVRIPCYGNENFVIVYDFGVEEQHVVAW